jgi:hypothetical protein
LNQDSQIHVVDNHFFWYRSTARTATARNNIKSRWRSLKTLWVVPEHQLDASVSHISRSCSENNSKDKRRLRTFLESCSSRTSTRESRASLPRVLLGEFRSTAEMTFHELMASFAFHHQSKVRCVDHGRMLVLGTDCYRAG